MVMKRANSIIVISLIFISLFTCVFFISPIILTSNASPGNISDSWDNSTTLNVTVFASIPRINWYDFQYNNSGSWVTKLNQQIDVNNSAEYRFIINISSDQGWDDINYVNITGWYDNGNEDNLYNQTEGGNINLFLQYENTTGKANWSLQWPNDEVIQREYSEIEEIDQYGITGNTECRNLTFSFIPSYQFRYAPGDGEWNNSYNTTDDAYSWNFNITVTDSGEGASQTYTVWINDEFGVYSYSEIVSAGWPVIIGNPGENATAATPINLITRSNGNYSLSVDVDNLTLITNPIYNISRDKVWVYGGDLAAYSNFSSEGGNIYFYGSETTYHQHEANGTSLSTNDIEYKCDIPIGQMPGDYTATIRYHLNTTK